MEGQFSHVSVLLNETVDGLNVKPGGVYADGTLGGGGHSFAIAKKGGKIIGIDRDANAIRAAGKRLEGFDAVYVKDNYNNIKEILQQLNIDKIDGAVLDLGVSSHQLDTPERGFSYRFDAPLDMRMDQDAAVSAYEIVNTWPGEELERILFSYGEEPFTKSIVQHILEKRRTGPISTTFELVEIIRESVPQRMRFEGKHPAKRTFQAIRIAVNDELTGLSDAVKDFCGVLKPGGRLAVITFHSLEDRIVKTAFKELAQGCVCPKEFPVCVCGRTPEAKIITKKPVLPGAGELENNPRAASSKLRILEKR